MLHTNQQTDAATILNAVRQSAAIQGISFAEMLKRLDGIDKKLEKRIAYWKTQEAIQAFLEHVAVKHAQPKNHDHWTRAFAAHFRDKNIAEIPPAEIEGFLFANWGECERSTWNHAKSKVSGFYSFVIKELKRRGSPSFHNPCDLIDDMKNIRRKAHEFLPVDRMKGLLETFKNPSHWLWFHILVTAGLRISELTELRPMDVSGRVLTLGGGMPCKSGRPFGEERAVIPQIVADKLKDYMAGMREDERIFKTTHRNIWGILKRRCDSLKTSHLSPHDLRRWCATFHYEITKEISAVRFVLRHSSLEDDKGNTLIDPLTGRYIISLAPETMMAHQDRVLVKNLFGGENSP